MREVFVRRVAGFLVALLLGVLLSSDHGVFRGSVARALSSGSGVGDDCEQRRYLTPPVLSAEEVAALHRGEYTGPYCPES